MELILLYPEPNDYLLGIIVTLYVTLVCQSLVIFWHAPVKQPSAQNHFVLSLSMDTFSEDLGSLGVIPSHGAGYGQRRQEEACRQSCGGGGCAGSEDGLRFLVRFHP